MTRCRQHSPVNIDKGGGAAILEGHPWLPPVGCVAAARRDFVAAVQSPHAHASQAGGRLGGAPVAAAEQLGQDLLGEVGRWYRLAAAAAAEVRYNPHPS